MVMKTKNKTMDININGVLCPKEWVIKEDENGDKGFEFLDQELDPIECKFDYAGGVIINTKDYAYISISAEMMQRIADMVYEVEEQEEEQ